MILGTSHRDQPEKLKLELSEKNEKFTKEKKKKQKHKTQLFVSTLNFEATSWCNNLPSTSCHASSSFSIQLWKEFLAFFLCNHQKNPLNL